MRTPEAAHRTSRAEARRRVHLEREALAEAVWSRWGWAPAGFVLGWAAWRALRRLVEHALDLRP